MLFSPAVGNVNATIPMPLISTETHKTERSETPKIIKDLIQCESGGKNIKIVDTNGYYSYGILQYQLATFRKYGEKYGLIEKGLTNKELRILIMDKNLQIRLTEKILEEPNGWTHWLNCWNKIQN